MLKYIMKIRITIIIVFFTQLLCTFAQQNEYTIQNDEIILIAAYPYAIDKYTPRTLYQILSLEYNSVYDFQSANNLAADKIIGHKTSSKANQLFKEKFKKCCIDTKLKKRLRLITKFTQKDNRLFLSIRIYNDNEYNIKIGGMISFDKYSNLYFTEPYLFITSSISTQNEKFHAYGKGPQKHIELKNKTINANSYIEEIIEFDKLEKNQYGSVSCWIKYLCSDLSIQETRDWSMIPK